MYRHCPIITAFVGMSIVLFGVICSLHIIPLIGDEFFGARVGLVNGTAVYESFRKAIRPAKFGVYLFHVTNPAEVSDGAKPVLREMGPYIYDVYESKEIISVDEERDTIRYLRKHVYVFNSKYSGCRTEDDEVIVINPILMAGCSEIEAFDRKNLSQLAEAFPPELNRIFLKVKVRDFLFSGTSFEIPENYSSICGFMDFMPKFLQIDGNCTTLTFFMLNYINGTNFGPYEITRGIKIGTKGNFVSYQMNKKNLNIWSGKYCNMINGSDFRLFDYRTFEVPPNRIYTFIWQFCRSVFYQFEREEIMHGVKNLKYSMTKDILEYNEHNRCFCSSHVIRGEIRSYCPHSGTMDLYRCLKVNFLYSQPHFYLSSSSLLNYVKGLAPSKKLHSSYIYIEKHFAIPFYRQTRYQLNIEVKPFESVEILTNMTEGIFPILWTEEEHALSIPYANLINSNYNYIFWLTIGNYSVIAFGLLLMIFSVVLLMARDKLMCFSEQKKVTKKSNTLLMVGLASSGEFEISNEYPNLYPQLKNKNWYYGAVKRRGGQNNNKTGKY